MVSLRCCPGNVMYGLLVGNRRRRFVAIMQQQAREYGASDDVTQRDGDLVPKQPLPDSDVSAEKHSGRHNEHIYYRVLKRQGEKCGYRQPDGGYFAECGC